MSELGGGTQRRQKREIKEVHRRGEGEITIARDEGRHKSNNKRGKEDKIRR